MLIVFMVAVIRVHRTMDTQLPQPCTDVCEASPRIVLEVLPGHRYRINRIDVGPNELLPRLRSIYADRQEKIIEVSGHRGVRYDDVVGAMDLAKSAGVAVISVATRSSR